MSKLDVSAQENAEVRSLRGSANGLPVSRDKGVGDGLVVCVSERNGGEKIRLILANFGTSGGAEAGDLMVDLWDGSRAGEGEGEVICEGICCAVLNIGRKVDQWVH